MRGGGGQVKSYCRVLRQKTNLEDIEEWRGVGRSGEEWGGVGRSGEEWEGVGRMRVG